MIKLPTPLDDETERHVFEVMSCGFAVHEAQVLAYLKASGRRIALLMNFGGATLREGPRRIVL